MKNLSLFFLALLFGTLTYAQVGINASTALDPSAALEIRSGSTPKGLLTPRMTSADRLLISAPADGLMVYDTDLKSFYYYKGAPNAAWTKLNSDANGRSNFKLIKTAADLAKELSDGGGSAYLLNSATYYEINGTINLAASINLNNAYVSGLDANEDVLSFTGGTVFAGNTGGSIKNVTLKGASAFNIAGPGIATNSSLLVQNTIIDGMTTGVGTISGLGLYYGGIVQFVNNANGITYSNIGNCLLGDQAWLSSNSGTFEKFTGSFGLVQKASGFSTVDGSDIAFDVSASSLAIGTGTLVGTVFSGVSASVPGYINGYAAANTYPGFNFNNAWYVDSPGIPREGDAAATGGFSMDYNVGVGISVGTDNNNPSSIVKVINKSPGTTTYVTSNLFRFGSDSPNSLKYLGKKKRIFQVAGSISIQVPGAATYIVYIAKNGIPQTQYKIYGRGQVSGDIIVLPINGTIELASNDIVEIYLQRYTGSTSDPIVANLTVTLK